MSATETQTRNAAELYAQAWNENDPRILKEILDRCWHPDGTIRSNSEAIDGRNALLERIRAFRAARPEDRARITAGPNIHSGWFCFEADVVRPDGTTYSDCIDVGEVDEAGLIRRVVTFHGGATGAGA